MGKREQLKNFDNHTLMDTDTNLSKDLPDPACMVREYKVLKDLR